MVRMPPKSGKPRALFPGQGQGIGGGTVPLPAGVGAMARLDPDAERAALTENVRRGAMEMESGQLGRALQRAKEVLRLDPRHGDALHLAGVVEFKLGNLEQAKMLLGLAVKRLPKMALAWANLGNALRDLVEEKEAHEAFDQALRLDPHNIVALVGRAQLYRLTRRLNDSMADFDLAMKLRPDSAIIRVRSCETLIDQGRFRTALEYLHKAEELINEPLPDVYALIAEMNERISDLEKALVYAQKALDLSPTHPLGLRTKVKSLRRLKRYQEARDVLKNVNIKDMAPVHSGLLYAELGQVCDKLNDIDAAFENFTLMNEAHARNTETRKVDTQFYTRHLDEMLATFTKDFVASWTELPPIELEPGHKYPPAFLIGFPRSGTTLLDSILDAHPDAVGIEEQPMTRIMREKIETFPGGYPGALVNLTSAQRQIARDVYWDAVREQGFEPGQKLIVDKMPLNLTNAAMIRRIFPEAKIILALRHPADCVLSCFMQDFVINSAMVNFQRLDTAVHTYDQVMRLYQIYEHLLPINALRVRYENLVVDLRGEVGPVLDAMGLEWHDAVNDPAAHALAKGDIRTPSYSQVTEPLYTASRDRWRRYETYLKPYLHVLEPHIKYFGYTI